MGPFELRLNVYASRTLAGLLLFLVAIVGCANVTPSNKGDMKIAVLPFANFTEIQEVSEEVMPLVIETLKTRGFEVVSGTPVEEVLYRHRIRQTTLVSRIAVEALTSELGVNGVIVGMVSIAKQVGIPQIGISARMLALPDAIVTWANDVSLSGSDYTGAFNLGTVDSLQVLSSRAVHQLLASLKPQLEPQVIPLPTRHGPLAGLTKKESPTFFRDSSADFYGVDSLAVLPFLNLSERSYAGDIVTALFVSTLHNTGRFRVVEPGIVRDVYLRFRIQSIGSLDRFSRLALNRHMNAQGYLMGTVYEYVEGKDRVTSPPQITISARMVSALDGKVVWNMEHRRQGDDFNLFLDFDRIYSIIPLARITFAEMVETFSGS